MLLARYLPCAQCAQPLCVLLLLERGQFMMQLAFVDTLPTTKVPAEQGEQTALPGLELRPVGQAAHEYAVPVAGAAPVLYSSLPHTMSWH